MANFIRVHVDWSGPSAPLITTFNFQDGTGDLAQANACGDAVATFMNSARAVVNIAFSYTVRRQVDHVDLATNQKIGVFGGHVFGTAAGQASGTLLPPQNQYMINWFTGVFFGGREYRGRTFLPGVDLSQTTGTAPSAAAQLALSNAGTALINDANTALAVYSLTHLTLATITTAVAAPQYKVLRSRR